MEESERSVPRLLVIGLVALAVVLVVGVWFVFFRNAPPKASFDFEQGNIRVDGDNVFFDVNFDASESSDPDGSIVSYEWNFGDGTTGSGKTITHTYAGDWYLYISPGSGVAENYPIYGYYDITLTVTDDEGATSSQTQQTHVAIPMQGGSQVY